VSGERIEAKGYDQNWVLEQPKRKACRRGHRAYDPGSGRTLEISTIEPGVQCYTANHMEGIIPGKQGKTYGFRTAFCLETEHIPDSPDHPSFPSTELKPGQHYDTVTVFKFVTRTN
jgi:aldose 1-epimerase